MSTRMAESVETRADEGAKVEEQFRRLPEQQKRPRQRSRTVRPPGMPEPVSQDERIFWGKQFQSFLNMIGEPRGYPKIEDAMVESIGEPAALVARKRMPKAEENPEVVLLMVLAPWILRCLKVETERWARIADARRAQQTAAQRARGSVRGNAEREDNAREEPTLTQPLQMPSS